jgi:hypothetical protein
MVPVTMTARTTSIWRNVIMAFSSRGKRSPHFPQIAGKRGRPPRLSAALLLL